MVDKSLIMSMRLRGFAYLPMKGGMFVAKDHFKPENVVQFSKDYNLAALRNGSEVTFFNPHELCPVNHNRWIARAPKIYGDDQIKRMAAGLSTHEKWPLTGPHYTHYITSLPITLNENLEFVTKKIYIELNTDYTVIDLCKNKVEWYPEFVMPEFYGKHCGEMILGSSFNNAENLDRFNPGPCISKIDFTDFTGENLISMNDFCRGRKQDLEIIWRKLNPTNLKSFKGAFRNSAVTNVDLSTFPADVDVTGAFKSSRLIFAGNTSMVPILGYYDNKFLQSNIYMSENLLLFTNELPIKQFQQLCRYPACIKSYGYAFKLSDNLTEAEKEFLQTGGFYEFNQY